MAGRLRHLGARADTVWSPYWQSGVAPLHSSVGSGTRGLGAAGFVAAKVRCGFRPGAGQSHGITRCLQLALLAWLAPSGACIPRANGDAARCHAGVVVTRSPAPTPSPLPSGSPLQLLTVREGW